ncbi:unnamed protein product [Mucor circinelloides]
MMMFVAVIHEQNQLLLVESRGLKALSSKMWSNALIMDIALHFSTNLFMIVRSKCSLLLVSIDLRSYSTFRMQSTMYGPQMRNQECFATDVEEGDCTA